MEGLTFVVVRWPSEHFGQRLALAWFRPLEAGSCYKGAAEQAHYVATLSVLREAVVCGVDDCAPHSVKQRFQSAATIG